MFIQEFYSNIHAIDTFVPQFTTVFRGTHIVVTPELISNVPCVPGVAHPDYPSSPYFCSLSLSMSLPHASVSVLYGGVILLTSPPMTLLRV